MKENHFLQSSKLFGYPLIFLIASIFVGEESLDIPFYNSFLISLSGAELILIGVIALIDLNFEIKKKILTVAPIYHKEYDNHYTFGRLLILASALAYIIFKLKLQKRLGEVELIFSNKPYISIFYVALSVGLALIGYCVYLIIYMKKTYGTN